MLFWSLSCGPYLIFSEPENCRKSKWGQWAHDTIARRQHLRRKQRVLRSPEHQHVPDTALSRAQPPGEPQPTDAALSRTSSEEEEPLRLKTATEEEIAPVVEEESPRTKRSQPEPSPSLQDPIASPVGLGNRNLLCQGQVLQRVRRGAAADEDT